MYSLCILSFLVIRSLSIFKFSKLRFSTNSNDLYKFIFNDAINPKVSKDKFFQLWSEKSEADKEILKIKSESEILKLKLDSEILKIKLENKKLKLHMQVNTLINDLERSQSTLTSINPRILIEYVENGKMIDSKNLSRKDKWVKYLSSDDGKILFECIKSSNKLWGDSVEKVSAKIDEIYSIRIVLYSTARRIADEDDNVVIERLANRVLEFNLSVCIASAYGIS